MPPSSVTLRASSNSPVCYATRQLWRYSNRIFPSYTGHLAYSQRQCGPEPHHRSVRLVLRPAYAPRRHALPAPARAHTLNPSPPRTDQRVCALAALLERTPTLEHVAWRYLEPGPLVPGTLPTLRSLRADVLDSPGAAGRGLLPGAALAALGPVCVSPCTLDAMAQMRGEALRALDVARFESIALLVRAVRLFASAVAPRARGGLLARACTRHACARTQRGCHSGVST